MLLAAIPALGLAQPASPDARSILENIGKTYRTPSNIELKGTKIVEQHDQFMDTVFRSAFTLILTPDNRVREESKTRLGTTIQVWDGEKKWNYTPLGNKYFTNTSKPEPASLLGPHVDLRAPATDLKDAKLLRQETLEVEGTKHFCDVVEATYEPKQNSQNVQYGAVTFWVDHQSFLVWKVTQPVVVDIAGFGGKMPSTETALFSSIETGLDLPAGTFKFTPPPGATEQESGAPGTSASTNGKALLGRPAPDFNLRDLDGKQVQLSGLKGKVVLLDFWATWCEPCREEIPKLDRLSKEFKEKNVLVLGIDVNEEEDVVRTFVDKNKIGYPILLTSPNDRAIASYSAYSYPTTVLIDKNGIVAAYDVGSSDRSEETLRAGFVRVSSPAYTPPKAAALTASASAVGGVSSNSTPVVNWPDPKTADEFVLRGYRYLRDRKYSNAVDDANAALKLKADWVPALRLHAQASYDLKNYQATIDDDTAILAKSPNWPEIHNQRGLAYSYSGKHDVAIADYEKAIELDPYVASPYNARGWAYLEMGDLDRALPDLNHAIELSPDFARAYTNRARLFDKKNDLKSELADLEALLRIDPANQWAKNQREEVLRRIGSNLD